MRTRIRLREYLFGIFKRHDRSEDYSERSIDNILFMCDRIAVILDVALIHFYEKTPSEHVKMYEKFVALMEINEYFISIASIRNLDYAYRNFLEMLGVNPKPIKRRNSKVTINEIRKERMNSTESFSGIRGNKVEIILSKHAKIVLEKKEDGSYLLILN